MCCILSVGPLLVPRTLKHKSKVKCRFSQLWHIGKAYMFRMIPYFSGGPSCHQCIHMMHADNLTQEVVYLGGARTLN